METTFEQFKACLTRSVAREALGIDLSEAESARIAQDDILARAYYDNWLRTGPTRSAPPVLVVSASTPTPAPNMTSTIPAPKSGSIWTAVVIGAIIVFAISQCSSGRSGQGIEPGDYCTGMDYRTGAC